MKKILRIIVIALFSTVLVACGAQTNSDTSNQKEEQTLTLIIKSDQDTSNEEVTFEEGDTIMDILEDNHKIEETSGMVTSIDGVKQDEKTNTYWMYKINDEMAAKGAAETDAVAGDTVEFYLESFE